MLVGIRLDTASKIKAVIPQWRVEMEVDPQMFKEVYKVLLE
tara:strand:- start:222 stop:344 length:123 start_codon:yes stop_codon:yes gene_type:complete